MAFGDIPRSVVGVFSVDRAHVGDGTVETVLNRPYLKFIYVMNIFKCYKSTQFHVFIRPYPVIQHSKRMPTCTCVQC